MKCTGASGFFFNMYKLCEYGVHYYLNARMASPPLI